MLRNYVTQHLAAGYKFHPEYESDASYCRTLKRMAYMGGIAGVVFAATVVNPNYLSRRSYYLRKIQCVLWGTIGYNLVNRYYEDQVTFTMLRMNDYFPMEIKRALRDKDFRHIALFDLE